MNMKLFQAVLLLSSVAASTSSDGSDVDIKHARQSSSYLRRRGRVLEGKTPVVDCLAITDEGSCITTPTTGHFCVWDAGSSTCTLDRPICPLLSPSECLTDRNLQLCTFDTINDSGCLYASANLWGTDLEASADWHGFFELAGTHVVKAKYETRRAPLPIADREAELLFTPTLEAPPIPPTSQPTMAPTISPDYGLESSSVVNSTITIESVTPGSTWTANPANTYKIIDGDDSEYYIPNTEYNVNVNFDLGAQRIVQGLFSQTWYVTNIGITSPDGTGSIRVGLKADDGCEEDMEDGGVNDCFPDSGSTSGWTWYDLSSEYDGYNTVRELSSGWMPSRYVQFQYRGGHSTYSSNWGIRNVKISGLLDGSATPGGGGGPNEETDPYSGYPYIAPVDAIVRMTVHAADGSLLGTSNLRDPSRIRPLLEQAVTTTELEPYSNGTAWSSTLPWYWMKEGTKITVGAVDPSAPERLLIHELTLHKLAMWGRHTLTRTKVLIFGDKDDVANLDTFTHPAEKLVNGMFGAMPTSELHWVDSPDWHLPCIVQGTNTGPAYVCSEAERRAALLAAGQNDTGSEPGWDILKNQFALKANNANNGRGLAITGSGEGGSPFSSNTNIFMGWSLSIGPTQSGSMSWDPMGYWSAWSAAAWTGWTGMRPGDECGNTLIHELGHSQTMSHFTSGDPGAAVNWGIEDEYPDDGVNMPYHPWGYDTASRRFRTWYYDYDPPDPATGYIPAGKRDPMNGGSYVTAEICFPQYTAYHALKSQNWAQNSHILISGGNSAGAITDGAYKYSAETLQYEKVEDGDIGTDIDQKMMPPIAANVPIITLIGTLGENADACQIYEPFKSSSGNVFQIPDPFTPGHSSVYDGGKYYIEITYDSLPPKRGIIAVSDLTGSTELRYFSLNLAIEDGPNKVELYRFDTDAYPTVTSSSAKTLLFSRPINLGADPLASLPATYRAGRDWLGASGDVEISKICITQEQCSSGANVLKWRGDGSEITYGTTSSAIDTSAAANVFEVAVTRQEDASAHTIKVVASRFYDDSGDDLSQILGSPASSQWEVDSTHGVTLYAPYSLNAGLPAGTYSSAPGSLKLWGDRPDSGRFVDIRVSVDLEILQSTDVANLSNHETYVGVGYPVENTGAYFVVVDPATGPTSGKWYGDGESNYWTRIFVPLHSTCLPSEDDVLTATIKAQQSHCGSTVQMNGGRVKNTCTHSLVLTLEGSSINPWMEQYKGCHFYSHPFAPIEFIAKRWHEPDPNTGLYEMGEIILDIVVDIPIGGGLLETWYNIPGSSVSDLTSHPDYPDAPQDSGTVPMLEAPSDRGSDLGSRLRAFIVPPETGEYKFYVASDDSSELWLSTDTSPANANLIAFVNGWTSKRNYLSSSSQASTTISLQKGLSYYVEAIHKEGGGGDHLSVAWKKPSSIDIKVVSGADTRIYRAINTAPVAGDDAVETNQDESVLIRPFDNDTDEDGDRLVIFSHTNGASGTVTDNNDGTLTYTPTAGYNGIDTFQYTASDGYGGVGTAEVTVTVGTPVTNHCTVNPCQNGGTCEEIPGDYLCSCVFGWGGKDCGINTDDCYPEPCLNGGTCTDLLGSYECSCPAGWEGTNCDTDVDQCTLGTHTCDANAICSNTDGSYTCTCMPGYSGDGYSCSDADECTLGTDNCDTNASCQNAAGGFTCTCNEGYEGDGTSCIDVDECSLGTDNCDTNSSCQNTAGGFTCTCNEGYGGDGTSCSDVDECALGIDNCDTNASCQNTAGGFICSCNPGYEGDGFTCSDADECSGSNNCDPNASCQNMPGGYECTCIAGYTGNGFSCTKVTDAPTASPSSSPSASPTPQATSSPTSLPTKTVQVTVDLSSSFTSEPYETSNSSIYFLADDPAVGPISRQWWGSDSTGDTLTIPLTASQCDNSNSNGLIVSASINGRQKTVTSSTTWQMSYGRSANNVGHTLVLELNDATLNPWLGAPKYGGCTLSTASTIQINAHRWHAPDAEAFLGPLLLGFTLTMPDVDECTMGTHTCDTNAICSNTSGSYTCTCMLGYSGDGYSCSDEDECALDTDNCDANASCQNTAGGFTCTCNEGYEGDGTSCIDVDECSLGTDNCDTNASCQNVPGGYTCSCNAGYNGNGFQCTDVDECASGTDNCDTNSSCQNTAGGFTCTCNEGYGGDGTSCSDVDECALGIDNCDTNASCQNTAGGFICSCNPGYEGDGFTCSDADECSGSNNCDPNASCQNMPGGYECTCIAGYTGNGFSCTKVTDAPTASPSSSPSASPTPQATSSPTSLPTKTVQVTVDLSSSFTSEPYETSNSSIYFLADDPAVGPISRQWWGSDSTGDTLTIPLTASQCDNSNSNGLIVSASINGRQKTVTSSTTWQMSYGRSANNVGHTLVLELNDATLNPWLGAPKYGGCTLSTASTIQINAHRWHAPDAEAFLGPLLLDFTFALLSVATNSPTSAPTSVPWQEIFFNDFESGTWDGWTDGGADAALTSNANNAHSGTYALRIQDDTASSTVTSSEIDTTSFSTIKGEFFFKPKRMTASSEEFHFDISTDGGASFTPVKTWTNQDMTDNQWNRGIIDDLDVSGTDRLHVRFECEGSANQDRIFIDDIKMEGK